MNEKKVEIVQVPFEHPMEQIFGLTPGSTMVDRYVAMEPEEDEEPQAEAVTYDDKDNQIDGQFQQIFDAAYMTFEAQRMATEGMNPQFQARALEVAQQFLNTALAAVSEKAKLKAAKDKVKAAPTSAGPGHTTNNTIIMGRNDMLKHIMDQAAGNIIDNE